jgi:hypothetical protein
MGEGGTKAKRGRSAESRVIAEVVMRKRPPHPLLSCLLCRWPGLPACRERESDRARERRTRKRVVRHFLDPVRSHQHTPHLTGGDLPWGSLSAFLVHPFRTWYHFGFATDTTHHTLFYFFPRVFQDSAHRHGQKHTERHRPSVELLNSKHHHLRFFSTPNDSDVCLTWELI